MPSGDQPNVGQVLRKLRERKNYSLRDLSKLCGLSINTISMIERGENSPTVASLHKLAQALEVHISDLFSRSIQQETIFTKADKRIQIKNGKFVFEGLGSGLRSQKLEPFLMVIQAGTNNSEDPVQHMGEEFVFCLEGSFTYFINHQAYEMQSGDSILFKANQTHYLVNSSKKDAKVIMIFETTDTLASPHALT